jgi:hypothetical protein
MGAGAMLIYTSVYGSYVTGYWKYSFGSLQWPKNLHVVKDAEFRVFTDEQDRETLEKIFSESGLRAKIGIRHKEEFAETLSEACDHKTQMLFAPPDMIFSDGSIANMLHMCWPTRAIAAAHIRVLPSILNEIDGPMSGAQLVAAAFRHLHSVFANSKVGKTSNSFDVGTSWSEIDAGLYAVTFQIPTVHMLHPCREDVGTFADGPGYKWDHDWPSSLIEGGRYRLAGSSDLAFAVEVTPSGVHGKAVQTAKPGEPDLYRDGQKLHCRHNSTTLITLRGGNA